jgi:hypothetical protein
MQVTVSPNMAKVKCRTLLNPKTGLSFPLQSGSEPGGKDAPIQGAQKGGGNQLSGLSAWHRHGKETAAERKKNNKCHGKEKPLQMAIHGHL